MPNPTPNPNPGMPQPTPQPQPRGPNVNNPAIPNKEVGFNQLTNFKFARVEPFGHKFTYARGDTIPFLLKFNNEGADQDLELRIYAPTLGYKYINDFILDLSEVNWMQVDVPVPANAPKGMHFVMFELVSENEQKVLKEYSVIVVA
jgi:hypothetical protein